MKIINYLSVITIFGVVLSSISIGEEVVHFPSAGPDRTKVEYKELTKEEQAAYKIFEYSVLNKNAYILHYVVFDSLQDYNNLKAQVIKDYNANFIRCFRRKKDTYIQIEISPSTGKFSIEMPISGGGGVALRVVFKKIDKIFKIVEWANPD